MKARQSLVYVLAKSLVVVALLMIGIIFCCYRMTRYSLRTQADENVQHMLTDTAERMAAALETVKTNGKQLATNSTIYDFMTSTADVRLTLRDETRQLLCSLADFSSGATCAFLVARDGTCLSGTASHVDWEGSPVFLACRRIQDDYMLTQPFRQSRITQCYTYGSASYYGVLIPIYPSSMTYSGSSYCGALVVMMDASTLGNDLPVNYIQEMIVAQDDLILAGAQGITTRQWRAMQQEGIHEQCVSGTTWQVYACVSGGYAPAYIHTMRQLCLVIGAGTLIVLAFLVVYQYRKIVNPIMNIAQQVSDPHLDEQSITNPTRHWSELALLTDSINSMKERLQRMNQEVLRAQWQSYEDQITLLQAQINPHFLYNNFECIRGMAAEGNITGVRDLASSIASIYRYCCKGERMVALRMEIACVAQYRRIIDLRYDGKYSIDVEADEDALDFQVPRMILEPIVENAVSHGLAKRPGADRVQVRAHMLDGELTLEIADNGIGMTAQQLTCYNASCIPQDDTACHMGIGNVMRRLEMTYGRQCAMTFENGADGGLCIRIRIHKT